MPGPGECGESYALYSNGVYLPRYYKVIVSNSVWMRKQHQGIVAKKPWVYIQKVIYLTGTAVSLHECLSLRAAQLSGSSSGKVCCVFPFHSGVAPFTEFD